MSDGESTDIELSRMKIIEIHFYIKLYILTVPIFFIIDIIWIGLVAQGLYQRNLASLLSPEVDWAVAVIFYLIYIAGLIIFAVRPAVIHKSIKQAIVLGSLFGFFTYATYDLTNLATLKDWPVSVTIIDMVWGTFLGMSVSGVSFMVSQKLHQKVYS